jgi:hypothetical protein
MKGCVNILFGVYFEYSGMMMWDVGCAMWDVRYDLRGTMYDVRGTMYDVRGAIYACSDFIQLIEPMFTGQTHLIF